MVRTNRPLRAARQYEADRDGRFDDETPLYSDPTEETFDDLIADLTHGLNEELEKSALAAVPSIDDFHSEDAAVRNMATRLAPGQKPRIKVRRPRYRRADPDRWRSPDDQSGFDERNDGHHADRWDRPRSVQAPRKRGRISFWGVSAGLLFVASVAAAVIFVKPLNDIWPNRIGDITGERVARAVDRSDAAAEFQVAGDTVGDDPKPLASEQASETPTAAAANSLLPAIPVSTAAAEPAITPPAAEPGPGSGEQADTPAMAESDPGSGEQSDLLAAAGGQALDLGATGRQPDATDFAAGDVATPESPPAAPEKSEDRLPGPDLQRSVQADPTPVTGATGALARAEDPVSDEAQPVQLPLSAAQTDRLLARGEERLQNGDIVPARMIFLRVAAAGDQRGAMGVAMTYDPDVYARLGVAGLTPDREKADRWYDKAGDVPQFTLVRKTRAAEPEAQNAEATAPDALVAKPKTAAARPEAAAAKPEATAAAEPYVGTPERNAACAEKYKSFDPQTGLYKSFSGVMRPCRLP